ncbi:Carboxylic ester hydrolase [Colletotrichum sp. SAR 10_98]|nr:Carboxylic ester hydrolase [Colletotrichum sp. SAR 10_98]
MKLDYPLLREEDITAIMNLYDIAREQSVKTLYDTNGLTPPFATSHSGTAKGWLQAAYNLYAEATFVCPAMWLADAFARGVGNSTGQSRSWRYQYSPPPAFHDDDLDVLMKDVHNTNDTDGADESVGFRLAFQSIWGRFIIEGDPTLTDEMIWNIQRTGENVTAASTSQWPSWGSVASGAGGSDNLMLNLNLTLPEGGVAKFDVVDGFSWEGGRGDRCNLWADLGYWIQA